jgi:glycosyltransferase involved in cell wall biosynthesis
MKILHIIDSGGLYGAEAVLLNLVGEQIKLGLSPTICSIGEPDISEKPLEIEALKRGFDVKKFRMRPGPNIVGAWKILKFAHGKHFNLMHSHGYKGNILFGFIPKKVRKMPLITTLHGWTSINSMTRMRLFEWLDVWSLYFIDAVVLVNKAMQSNSKLRNSARINFYVINNGIPDSDTNTPIHQHSNTHSNLSSLDGKIIDFCKKGYTIGAIGRLSPEKGFSNLLEAVRIVSLEDNDFRLVIIGEGGERNSLENRIKELCLQSRVLLPGYRKDAKRYLPYFKVFALSSFTEGLPITILEAMHAGVPILSTRVGGVPEVLDDGKAGILVDPMSPTDIARGILKLRSNPEIRKEITERAKEILRKKYSSERMAFQYFAIYKRLIHSKI